MKTKPNTEQFKMKKDPSSFLEGGAADLTERKSQITETSQEPVVIAPPTPVVNRVHREQKIFRLPIDLVTALRDEAYERGRKTGIRVTETELIEQALRAFLKR
jgi:hypothetical protein